MDGTLNKIEGGKEFVNKKFSKAVEGEWYLVAFQYIGSNANNDSVLNAEKKDLHVIEGDKFCEIEFSKNITTQTVKLNFYPQQSSEKNHLLQSGEKEHLLSRNLVYSLHNAMNITNKKDAKTKVEEAITNLFLDIIHEPSIFPMTTKKLIIYISFKGYDSLKDLINDDKLLFKLKQ
ncbi:15167_t:CDS:2 [Racocetra persica]|uniref:15167_t:CDS:1 n=1 Tax=Racocetra persica TaxID=160502 RepID=A0ACA9MIX7_9GLOM|nr:15167_t:CDS:2 [Racocetra persica]